MESCCQYGSESYGTDRDTIAKKPMPYDANENDEKEPQNVKQGYCVHGFGKDCATSEEVSEPVIDKAKEA